MSPVEARVSHERELAPAHTSLTSPSRFVRVALLVAFAAIVAFAGTFGAVTHVPGAPPAIGFAVAVATFAAWSSLGPGAARAIAISFASLLPIQIVAAYASANVTLFGTMGFCGTRLMETALYLAVVCSIGCAVFAVISLHRAAELDTTHAVAAPLRSHGASRLLASTAVVLAVGASLGIEQTASRPTLADYRSSFATYAMVDGRELDVDCSRTKPCTETIFDDGKVHLLRECESPRACRATLRLPDGRTHVPSLGRFNATDRLRILREPETQVWALEAPLRDSPGLGAVPVELAAARNGVGGERRVLFVSDVRGAIAPDPTSVLFAGFGVLGLLASWTWVKLARRRAARVLAAKDGVVDPHGRVIVEGEDGASTHPIDERSPPSRGAVLVDTTVHVATFRTPGNLPALIFAGGTKAEHLAQHRLAVRDVAATAWVTAVYFAVPLIGAALAGRLF